MKDTTISIEETIQEINKQNKRIEELCLEIERLNENNQAMQEEMARTWKKLDKKENIIKEVREEIRILESNCDISDYQAQKLYQLLDKGE